MPGCFDSHEKFLPSGMDAATAMRNYRLSHSRICCAMIWTVMALASLLIVLAIVLASRVLRPVQRRAHRAPALDRGAGR